jgi:hypothetical protein
VLVLNIYFGLAYGSPIMHILFWRRAKGMCEHLYSRLSAGTDKAVFAFSDYCGLFDSPDDIIALDKRVA